MHKQRSTEEHVQSSAAGDISDITARLLPYDREDTEQEARLRVLQTASREKITNPIHLARRIAHNLVVDHLRRQKRERPFLQTPLLPEAPCPLGDPERSLLVGERLRSALSIIESMPPRRREAFLMHRIEGLSYTQIARRMSVTPKAIEKHMTLAMIDLARGMEAKERPQGRVI